MPHEIAAAQEAAYKAIEVNNVVRLSTEDQHGFAELILDPPALTPTMKRAKQAHSDLIRKSS